MSKRTGVLWDLDNTLLPSKPLTHQVFEVILPEFGIETPTKQDIHDAFGMKLPDFLAQMSGGHTDQAQIYDRFIEEQSRAYEDEILLFDGMLEVIAELGELGVHQAIVTTRGNHDRGPAGAVSIVEKSGIGTYIDVVVSGEDTNKHKPHPKPIKKALKLLQVKPQNAVMIGDQSVDMEAGVRAGVHTLGIDHDMSLINSRSLVDAGAEAVRYRPESIVPYIHTVLKIK